MRVAEVDFITLVQGTKQFQIPLYQRVYSWQKTHVDQLCLDIVAEAERQRETDAPGHFLGSLVLAPSPFHDGELQQATVVDGQQRLTSLMIALSALRDHVAPSNGDWARRITEDYLTNKWQQGDRNLRLLPTQVDRDDFRACVRGDGIRLRDTNMGTTYRAFRAWFLEIDNVGGSDMLQRTEFAIRNGLRFVSITADPSDNVHRIFETINNTGLKLSQADLIRNYFFMLLPNRANELYHDTWLPMQKLVGEKGIEILLWLDLVMRGDDKADPDDLYRRQAERFKQQGTGEAEVAAELKELTRKAHLLQLILEPEYEADPALRHQLERLREWGGRTALPAAMFLVDLRDRSKASTADVVAGLRLIESFLVRRMIADVRTSPSRIIGAIPSELAESTRIVDDLRAYLSAERRSWPTDAQVREAIQAKRFYRLGDPGQRTFVLRRLEDAHRHPERLDWSQPVYSIEHIMPQSMTLEWLAALRPEAIRYGVTPRELHQMLLHTIGNLTLTGNNQRLGNHPFSRKREILADSGLAMNRKIADSSTWGGAEIEQRGAALASLAVEIWPGPADGARVARSDDWNVLRRALALTPAAKWVGLATVASLIGKRPVEVTAYLLAEGPTNWHRVLGARGSLLRGPRSADRAGEQRSLLQAEGVRFSAGLADASRQVPAAELERLLGYDVRGAKRPVVLKRSAHSASSKPRKR